MWQHRADSPTQPVQEAALATFHHPALLVETPLLGCQEIYSMTFGVSSSLPLVKRVHKNAKLKLKQKEMKSTSFSVPQEKMKDRIDLQKPPTKSLCLGNEMP